LKYGAILKYRETLVLEYTMGHISFEDLHTLIDKDAEDVKLFKMQVHSKAYQDWLSAENDVYDEVFKDESA